MNKFKDKNWWALFWAFIMIYYIPLAAIAIIYALSNPKHGIEAGSSAESTFIWLFSIPAALIALLLVVVGVSKLFYKWWNNDSL